MGAAQAAAGDEPSTMADDVRQGGFAPGAEAALWAVVVIWASTWIALKDAFAFISPLAFVLLRFLLMNVLAFGVLLIRRSRGDAVALTIRRADLPVFLLAGGTGFTLYQLCAVLGLDRSSVFTLSLLVAMVPLFTMLILAVRGEPIPPFGWLGLAIAIAGVAIFLVNKREGGDTLSGALLSLGAAVSFAVYGVVSRPLTKRYPSPTYAAYTLLIGTVPFVFIGGPSLLRQDWSLVPARVWLGLIYLVIFPVYVAYQLWNYAISRRGAAAASSYGLIVPVISGTLSAVILHERFGPAKIIGAAVTLAGLMVLRINRDPAR